MYREQIKLVDRLKDGGAEIRRSVQLDDEIECLLLAKERTLINDLYRDGKLKDEPRRRIERDLDLRDAQLLNLRSEE